MRIEIENRRKQEKKILKNNKIKNTKRNKILVKIPHFSPQNCTIWTS